MPEPAPRSSRSAMFARSDLRTAAEEFVAVMAEHGGVILDNEADALAEALTEAALRVLRDERVTFGTVTDA